MPPKSYFSAVSAVILRPLPFADAVTPSECGEDDDGCALAPGADRTRELARIGANA